MSSGMVFSITKSFGRLDLLPLSNGLMLQYAPVVKGQVDVQDSTAIELTIPLEAVGGIWATARAFLYAVESLDENIVLRGNHNDVLIRLYRDKPSGPEGRVSGDEFCWLRIVTGRLEHERRRIKLGPRDLLAIELACNSVMMLAAAAGPGAHKPVEWSAVKTEKSEDLDY